MFVFQMPNINHFLMWKKKKIHPSLKTDCGYIFKKKSKAILRKIILLKSKILLEWGNCLNSPSDKCPSCWMQKQQPERHLPQEGNQDPLVSSLGPFNQKKTQHFPRGITAEVHPSWPQTFPDRFGWQS